MRMMKIGEEFEGLAMRKRSPTDVGKLEEN
jgi:hypothetical protein